MADLPVKPSMDHLRRQARDLLRAAQAGDTAAVGRSRAVSVELTLATAQLAVAREYGFASWTKLKDEVTARTADLAQQAEAFCEASIRDWTGRAARMLEATPEIAGYNFATAVVLGDASRVRTEIGRDPGLAAQVIEAGPGRKIRHDVSFTGLRSARQAWKGDRRDLLPENRGGLRPARGPGGTLSHPLPP